MQSSPGRNDDCFAIETNRVNVRGKAWRCVLEKCWTGQFHVNGSVSAEFLISAHDGIFELHDSIFELLVLVCVCDTMDGCCWDQYEVVACRWHHRFGNWTFGTKRRSDFHQV